MHRAEKKIDAAMRAGSREKTRTKRHVRRLSLSSVSNQSRGSLDRINPTALRTESNSVLYMGYGLLRVVQDITSTVLFSCLGSMFEE